MAIFEYSGTLKYKDKAGNLHIMKPRTTSGNVEGLTQLLAEKENSGAAATALENAKAYTDQKIEGIPTPDVSAQIKAHNESQDAHPYIRGLIPTKTSQLENDSGYLTQHQDISGKLDKPTNDATATVGQLLTKTANGQEWQDREKATFIVTLVSFTEVDKTVAEIKAAKDAGRVCFLRYNRELYPLFAVDDTEAVFAQSISPDGKTIVQYMITVDADGNVSVTFTQSQPPVEAAGLLKGDGNGTISAAVAGTDYIASGNIVKQTLVATETTPTENYAINWVYG